MPLLFFFFFPPFVVVVVVTISSLLLESAESKSMCSMYAGCAQFGDYDADIVAGSPSEGNADVEDASGASEGIS